MKWQVYFGIALRIVLLFMAGFLLTYITPHLREIFGDTPCSNCVEDIDSKWNWGARHYWYAMMIFFLFLLSLVNVIVGCVQLIKKYYNL